MDPKPNDQRPNEAEQLEPQAGDETYEMDEDEQVMLSLDDAIEILQNEEDGQDQREDEDSDDSLEEERPLVKDTSVAHFASHSNTSTQAIFCVAAHPTSPLLAASGGEDDLGYIWRTDTGEEIAKLSGHEDSVACIAWSSDGEMIATGGLDGKVRVWRRRKPEAGGAWEWAQWEFLTSLEGPDEVTTLIWHPKGPVLVAGSTDSTIWMWNLPSGKNMSVFSSHQAPITSLFWSTPTEGKRLLSADSDSSLCIWNPQEPSAPLHRLTSNSGRFALPGGITTMTTNASGSLALLGGAEEGALRIINLTNGSFVGALVGGHAETASVEAVTWVDLKVGAGLWVSAATDGTVCAWEVSNGSLRWRADHTSEQEVKEEGTEDSAVSNLLLHPNKQWITSSCADGTVRTWDVKSGKPVEEHSGHNSAVHGLALSQDGKLVISAGDDGIGRVHAFAT